MTWAGVGTEFGYPTWVRLFEAEPDLLAGMDPQRARQLARSVTVEALDLPAGAMLPQALLRKPLAALLVLRGVLAVNVQVAGRESVDLLGPGDVLRPGAEGGARWSGASRRWTTLVHTRLAILDEDFLDVAQRCKTVLAALIQRVLERNDALCERLAIASIPHLDERLLALFCHLAARWGREEERGTLIPIRLSHGILAEMACARRPPISSAAKSLERRGLVGRGPGGSWILFDAPAVPVVAPVARFSTSASVTRMTGAVAAPSSG